jgi:hypothetical protein
MKMIYEVIGWPKTCPSETWSEGLYTSMHKAEEAKQTAEYNYSNCSFDIETKFVME